MLSEYFILLEKVQMKFGGYYRICIVCVIEKLIISLLRKILHIENPCTVLTLLSRNYVPKNSLFKIGFHTFLLIKWFLELISSHTINPENEIMNVIILHKYSTRNFYSIHID